MSRCAPWCSRLVARLDDRRASPRRPRRALLAAAMAAVACASTIGAQARPRGDNEFQVGDRIVLKVEGEPQLSDTFTVTKGPALMLPIIGNLSLAGVRRDSVQKVLAAAVAKYYRDPSVQARALVRVAVLGEVLRPGFYAVPTDMLVPDVVMAAGGPTALAQIENLRITRLGADLMPRDSIQSAIAEGRTISQIDIRSEDQFVVPKAADSQKTIQMIATLITIPVAILTVILLLKK